MNDFSIILCESYREQITIKIRASFQNGALRIFGHELGEDVDTFWGEDEYEYWYSFSEAETRKLIEILAVGENLKDVLLLDFSGEDGCRKLIDVCDREGIHYDFFSHV